MLTSCIAKGTGLSLEYGLLHCPLTVVSVMVFRSCNCNALHLKKNSAAIDSETDVADEYRSYGQRWFILCSVLLLNISNYAHWIAFASVQSKAAEFYLLDHQGRKG